MEGRQTTKIHTVPTEETERQRAISRKIKALCQSGKTAFVQTYGCQQNENDSALLRGMLAEMGFSFTDDAKCADLILFNTCAVRENAELKVYGHVGALKHLKRRKPSLKIILCGCMMQQKGVADQIRRRYPHVDLVFGTHALYRFPELMYRVFCGERAFDTAPSDGVIAEGIPRHLDRGVKAGVSVMYGCNNFCSYCIVPYVRGRERSRDHRDVLREISETVAMGIPEIMLLGQNVNSYRGGCDFADLLASAAQISGLRRLRFMTSHPKDISEKLVRTIAEFPNICNQLHLPFQSGSNRVLQVMNRRYTREHYLELIRMVRSYLPDVALTSDVIVGFPGETEAEFEETLSLVEQVRFDSLFTFLYSRRPGTPAAEMTEQIGEEVKSERFDRLLQLQNGISREINETFFGKTAEVLTEGRSKSDERMMTGRTEGNKLVHFSGTEDLIGKFVQVKINKVQTWSLEGERIGKES